MSKVTVSVFMLTYNQEQFIAQAIDSILNQNTNFKYQLVIGEDFSADKTRKICEKYAAQFPEKIKLLPDLGKNVGLIQNYIRTIKACDGDFIAICDGDDYWIDDNKLQKQVDYLRDNPKCYILGTNFKRLYNNGQFELVEKSHSKLSYTFEDLIFENLVTSVTVMFRNIQNQETIPTWINKFPYGDWPTYLWTIKNNGTVEFLNDVTAVYRTDIGVSAKIRKHHSETSKVNLEIVKSICSDKSFSGKIKVIKHSVLKHKKELLACYNREEQYVKAFQVFIGALFSNSKPLHLIKYYLYSLKKSI
jgi:glycosyltransferase involved in cell wall biosynthesis